MFVEKSIPFAKLDNMPECLYFTTKVEFVVRAATSVLEDRSIEATNRKVYSW